MNSYFSPEALEALQQAYEMQLTPEEQDYDAVTGLPSNTVSNTSPWHGTVELWRYPDGVNKTPPQEILYTGREEEEEEEDEYYEEETEEIDDIESSMTEEEVDALIEELLSSEDD